MAKRATARNAGESGQNESLETAARQEMLAALDDLLAQQDFELSIPYNRLNQGVADLIANQGKLLAKLQAKIVKGIEHHLVQHDNVLNLMNTQVLNGINTHQQDVELLLQMLAYKGGMIDAGDPLTAALIDEATRGPEIAAQATMVLEISRLAPYFTDLIQVLREIRDRMPGSPVRYEGETPSSNKDESFINLDDLTQVRLERI